MPRARGYHYIRLASGRKRRVYSGSTRRGARPFRRQAFRTVRGRGAYYSGSRMAGGRPRGARRTVTTARTRKGGILALGFGGTDPPKMAMSSAGFEVSHREYIQDITSSEPFILENFPLNPGCPQTFPWLSQIALNFEEWLCEGMLFEFKTTSSNTVVNATTSNPGLGTVIIATQYNVANADFGNKQQMENYENAVSVDPSRSVLHPIECARAQTPVQPLYVRRGNSFNPQLQFDQRLYDLGRTSVATVGQQSNNFQIGELWVTYKIRFLKPRLELSSGTGPDNMMDHFELWQGGAPIGNFVDVKPTTPLGTQSVLIPGVESSTLGGVISGGVTTVANQQNIPFPSSLGGSKPFPIFAIVGGVVMPPQINSFANRYYFPPGVTGGVFMIIYTATYTNPGVVADQNFNASALITGAELFLGFSNNTLNRITNTATTSTHSDICLAFIQVTTNYASFAMSGTAGMTAPLAADFFVIEMPQNFQ